VVIGGGIAGCSAALHLARAGVADVLLVDKAELTSGSTHHAAGLVTQFNPSTTMMRFRRYSVELYESLGVFAAVGSVRIASSRDSWLELRRAASRAAAGGFEGELISPEEVVARLPEASPDDLWGGLWVPGDGYVDPHIATHAVADAARELGVQIRLRTRVTGIELGPRREVRAVVCGEERIETELVVCCAGVWAPQVAAMVGAFVPSVPVDHQHVLMSAVPGREIPRGAPCFRDPENLVYGKGEAGGMLIGGYEPEPVARWADGVPWEHANSPTESDMDRFAPLLEGAIRRFGMLDDAGVIRLLCHPDAMTPDGNPLLGPLPGVSGFWMAAGLSLNGFGGAGGLGRALAEWIVGGRSELDVHAYRAWRFGRVPYGDTAFAAETAREAYRYYYRLRYPLDVAVWGRGRRLSPLHSRLEDAGAVFGVKNGWERADWFAPGRPWRRAGEEQRAYGWGTPPETSLLAEEHRAVRERAGIFDLSSFGKLEVRGPGALALLQRVSCAQLDRPVGRVTYTQWLDAVGGIVADLTVTRLAEDAFRVVTGAGAVAGDEGWLRLHARPEQDGPVVIEDVSARWAVIGVWGPRAPAIVGRVTDADLSDAAMPFSTARTLRVGGAEVLAQRITFTGERGWELYVAPEWAVQVWDRLRAAGERDELRPCGYRALESLRIEKGYRYFGTDLTPEDTPAEGGVGFTVARDKTGFIGAGALGAAPRHRVRTLLVGDGEHVPIYGGEAVRRDGEIVGRVRSAAFAYTVGGQAALAAVPPDLADGTALTVDALGDRVAARTARDPLVG
jgi:glycine cleavage system aminomethyltransferase T/glycine/D-amino acid oxidase-like deaminating enzyme